MNRNINSYLSAVNKVINILNNTKINNEEKQDILRLWFNKQVNFLNLNHTSHYMLGIRPQDIVYQKNPYKSIKDSLYFYGIAYRCYSCECESFYFAPFIKTFKDWASKLNDNLFNKYLDIKDYEYERYFPNHGGYRCEGGLPYWKNMEIIILCENYLDNYPKSIFHLEVLQIFNEAISDFLLIKFDSPHMNKQESINYLIKCYNGYLKAYPKGRISEEVNNNLNKLIKMK